MLTLIRKYRKGTSKHYLGEFKCICGVYKIIRVDHVKSGAVVSCGCFHREQARQANYIHGLCTSKIFKIYHGMKHRCYNSKAKHYSYYGGRGIKICKRWLGKNGFINFASDMGMPPTEKHSIDRLDNSLGYSIKNCRWATWAEQGQNKSNTITIIYKDKKYTLLELSKLTNIPTRHLYARIFTRKWSIEKAVTTKARFYKKK